MKISNLRQGIEAIFRENDFAPGLPQENFALRRMVLLSSITITLTPLHSVEPVTPSRNCACISVVMKFASAAQGQTP